MAQQVYDAIIAAFNDLGFTGSFVIDQGFLWGFAGCLVAFMLVWGVLSNL